MALEHLDHLGQIVAGRRLAAGDVQVLDRAPERMGHRRLELGERHVRLAIAVLPVVAHLAAGVADPGAVVDEHGRPDRLEPRHHQRVGEIARHARRRAGHIPQRKAVFGHGLRAHCTSRERIIGAIPCSWSSFCWPGSCSRSDRESRSPGGSHGISIPCAASSSLSASARAATPVLINALGRLNLVAASTPTSRRRSAAVGLWLSRARPRRRALAPSRRGGSLRHARRSSCSPSASAMPCSAQRMDMSPDGIVLYGEYDTADMTYYAGEASEASHTDSADGLLLLGPQAERRLLSASRVRDDSPVRGECRCCRCTSGYAWPTFLVLSALIGFRARARAGLDRGRGAGGRAGASPPATCRIWRPGICRASRLPAPGTTSSGRRTFCRRRCRCCIFNTWGLSLPLFFTRLVRDRPRTADAGARLDRPQRVPARRSCSSSSRSPTSC